ncbi:MAG: pirin family protein [Polyangiaceae bacterium]
MTFPAPRIALPRRDMLRALAIGSMAPWAASLAGCESPPPAPVPSPSASANSLPPRLTAVPTMDGRGARVRRIFPTRMTGYQDPFVLLDDFSVGAPAGFPEHPHRGFEAFTYMIDGSFHHKDNLGNDSVVHTGGTQRFTSGRGARHSEMPVGGGENRGLQLWVNLPRSLKKMEPEYEAVHGNDLPEAERAGVITRTIVGPQSKVRLRTAVRYLHLQMKAGSRLEDEVPAGHTGLVYVAEGRVKIGDLDMASGEGARPGPGEIGLLAMTDAHAFVLVGAAHNEPIVHRGPYVD